MRNNVIVPASLLPEPAGAVVLITGTGCGRAVSRLHHVGQAVHHVILITRGDAVGKALQARNHTVGQT